MRFFWLPCMLSLLTTSAFATTGVDVARAHAETAVAAAHLATEAPRRTDTNIDARREAAIGIALYAEGDDFRAITALQRYRLLDGSPQAAYLSRLIMGHIHGRNDAHREARRSYELAAADAPAPVDRRWVELHAVQESCIGLSLYFECRRVYDELMASPRGEERVDEVTKYQSAFVDVVLRKPQIELPNFENSRLAARSRELLERHKAFDDLDLQRPWLAGTLSGLIPGAGQLYNGAWLDGLIAFGLTGGMGVASWYVYDELESVPGAIALGTITLGLYIGNIINAVTDAHRLNARTYRRFFEDLQHDLWPRVSFVVEDDRVLFGFEFQTDREEAAQEL